MNARLPVKICAAVVLIAGAVCPAMALTLDDLAGRWQGEGEYRIGAEPPQRLRCQMRGTPAARGIVVIGRCATAQGGQSFAWALSDMGDGGIQAEDRSPVTDDTAPSRRMVGRIGSGGLRFDGEDGSSFALVPDAGGLTLRLRGIEENRPVQAEARMRPAS